MYDPKVHHRRSIRLKGYDYSQGGAYFVTFCVEGRESIFGRIVDGQMRLSDLGLTVSEFWGQIPAKYQEIELDKFVDAESHACDSRVPRAVDTGFACRGGVSPPPAPRKCRRICQVSIDTVN